MQGRLQWESLLGTPTRVSVNKTESTDAAAAQRANDLVHVFSAVASQLRQQVGIPGLREFGDIALNGLLQLRGDGRGVSGAPVDGSS